MIHSTHIDSFLVHHATPLAQCLRKYRVIICLVIPVICKDGAFWMEACDQTVQGRPALAVSFRAFSIEKYILKGVLVVNPHIRQPIAFKSIGMPRSSVVQKGTVRLCIDS